MSFELIPLLRVLDAAGVRFVVIGGVAVSLHGPVRATEDLDIVPDPAPENLIALGNALVKLGAHLARDPATPFSADHRAALAQGRSLSLSTDLGDVDVVQRLPGVPGFAPLSAAAETLDVDGLTVRYASRDHLLAMKRARGGPQDLADIASLESAGG